MIGKIGKRIISFAREVSRRGSEFASDLQERARSPRIAVDQGIDGALSDADTAREFSLRYAYRLSPFLDPIA